MTTARNVLFVTCDQLRWDHMGRAGALLHEYTKS